MVESPDYRDLLLTFNESNLEYLIVGGYALMKYGEPRFTKDLDIWVNSTPGNSRGVYDALARFGAPVASDGITPETFTKEIVYQIGVAPVRIDIITHIDGVIFGDAWPNRVEGVIFGAPVHVISLADLIKNKQASGRTTDLEHLKELQRFHSKHID